MVLLALRGVLVFGCASLAVAQTADSCEEPVSLLQSDLQSRQRARRNALSASKDDSCQCLNWKQSYASGLVDCGLGLEYYLMTARPEGLDHYFMTLGASPDYPSPEDFLREVQKPKKRAFLMASDLSKGWCDAFYKVIDDNKCVRAAVDRSDTEWFGKSWCYVSSACSSAMPISSKQVSVKFCEEGTDSLLSDMAPTELMEYGKRMKFKVPGYFLKVAYPVDRTFYWKDRAQHEAELSKLKASGKPVVVDEIDEHQTKMIIFGNEVMRMEPPSVPEEFQHLACVENCPEV